MNRLMIFLGASGLFIFYILDTIMRTDTPPALVGSMMLLCIGLSIKNETP